MGVASNRVDVHQAAARAERSLERVAEPLSALFARARRVPGALLDIGWQQLVLNSAHDSSCACSADEVVEAVRVRYQEARHIGEALARDALRQLATTDRRPAVVDHRGQQHGAVARRHGRRRRCPATGPVHLVAVDDGAACPPRSSRTTAGEGFSTVVVGQKIRWVLEMMRGPELAGARIARVERRDARRRHRRVHLPRRRARRARDRPRSHARPSCSRWARRARPSRSASGVRPCSEVVVATDRSPGFGWRTYRRGRRARAGAPRCAPTAGTLANEHVRVEVDPDDGTLTIERRRRRRVAARNRYVDGGDGGDTYNYSPPATDTVVDRPDVGERHGRGVGPGARPAGRHRAPTGGPPRAIGDERSCTRRSDDLRAVDVRHHPRAAHRRAVPARARRARQPRARPPPAGPLPAPRARRRLRRRVRVRGRAPRAHRRGRTPRVRAADVRVAPVRRRVGRRRRARAAPRRPARVRGRRATARELALTLAAGHRLPVALGAGAAPEPGRPARSARGPAAAGPPRARLRRAPPPGRLAAPRRSPTRPTSSSCRSSACAVAAGAVRDAAPDRPARSASTAPRCRRSCATTPARSCVRVVEPVARTRRRPRSRRRPVSLNGDVVDLTGAVARARSTAPCRSGRGSSSRCALDGT